jgi:hypothetical protein
MAAMGAAVGTGLGCLGTALMPWVAVILGVLAAVVFVLIKKGDVSARARRHAPVRKCATSPSRIR